MTVCCLGQLNNNKQLHIYMMRKNYEIGMNLCVKTWENFSVIVDYIGRKNIRRRSQITFSSCSLAEDKRAEKIMQRYFLQQIAHFFWLLLLHSLVKQNIGTIDLRTGWVLNYGKVLCVELCVLLPQQGLKWEGTITQELSKLVRKRLKHHLENLSTSTWI